MSLLWIGNISEVIWKWVLSLAVFSAGQAVADEVKSLIPQIQQNTIETTKTTSNWETRICEIDEQECVKEDEYPNLFISWQMVCNRVTGQCYSPEPPSNRRD